MTHDSEAPGLPRREFLVRAGTTAILFTAVGTTASLAGCMKAPLPRSLRFATLDEALVELVLLEKARTVNLPGPWTIAQTLTHCAQSIEFTLTGFPRLRSVIIRRAIGPLVFRRFKGQGQMSHSLVDPIPGAPALSAQDSLAHGLARVRKAIAEFRTHRGALRPHFAYGELSRADAELAHAMHLANHLSAVTYG